MRPILGNVLDAVEVEEPALWVHRGPAPPMRGFHRHDDLEIDVVLDGGLDYLFGGTRVHVPAGTTAMFWAAVPHRLLPADPLRRSDVCWVHVPLSAVLRWTLPDTFTTQVLGQRTVLVPTRDLGGLGNHVPAVVEGWRRDLVEGADTAAMLLEVNALVLRILGGTTQQPERPRADLLPVARMAGWIAEHFREPVTTTDVARSANLNPNYATTLFRRSVGVSLGEQLVRHRVAEAQRLLLTTSLTTAAVAHAAGFGSQSSLYAHFARACGCSPGAYRESRASTATPRAIT